MSEIKKGLDAAIAQRPAVPAPEGMAAEVAAYVRAEAWRRDRAAEAPVIRADAPPCGHAACVNGCTDVALGLTCRSAPDAVDGHWASAMRALAPEVSDPRGPITDVPADHLEAK